MRRSAVVAVLLVAACAPPPKEPPPPPGALPTDTHRVLPQAAPVTSVDLENAADGTKVVLKRGNELKVILDADVRSGLRWRYPPNFAPVMSQLGERIFLTKGTVYLGSGGWNVFRYRADQQGAVTLVFEYGPFDEAAPAARSVRYHVTVE